MGRPGCKIRNKRNAEVDSLSFSLSLSDYSRVGNDTRARVRNVYVKDRSCDVCANRCCGSPPQPFSPSLPPFNRGINGAAPIRSNRSAINQRPRNGNVRNEPRLPLRYVRADQTRRKQTARGSFDIVLSNWETKLPTPDHRARVITRLIDVHLLLPPRAKSPPPERSVISHRSRHHFGLISKLRFVIYNGHVYSGVPRTWLDSLFSQLCPLRP